MQILEVPQFYKDMSYSVGMTGVTFLKGGRYKQRHGGSKQIVQIPTKGFDEARFHKPKKKPLTKAATARKKAQQIEKSKRPKPPKPKNYRIDKSEVTARIRGYVNQMTGEKMLYFWTVSFPQGTPDDTAYILLNKWFTRLRKEKMLKEYLWIAERQKNGTIHFHIVINKKMYVLKANRFMRACIMHSIDQGEIKYSRNQAKNYNGVDIAKDRKTKRVINFAKQNKQKALTNYLTKYITKNDETFGHLAWHSSRGYSNLITSVRFTHEEFKVSNTGKLLCEESRLEQEWFIHKRWKGSPPKDLLKYLADINQHIQSTLNLQT